MMRERIVIEDLLVTKDGRKTHTTLSRWVSLQLKERYRELQRETDRQFGEELDKVITHLIEDAHAQLLGRKGA